MNQHHTIHHVFLNPPSVFVCALSIYGLLSCLHSSDLHLWKFPVENARTDLTLYCSRSCTFKTLDTIAMK